MVGQCTARWESGTYRNSLLEYYGSFRTNCQELFKESPGIWCTLRDVWRQVAPLSRIMKVYLLFARNGFHACVSKEGHCSLVSGLTSAISVIWIRLGYKDSTINDRLSVHFFSTAFLSFVSCQHSQKFLSNMPSHRCPWQAFLDVNHALSILVIPSSLDPFNLVLEERSVYYRESRNGLYSTLPFVLSNTLVNIPFLFACTACFTLICYWAIVSWTMCKNKGRKCNDPSLGSTPRRNRLFPLPWVSLPRNPRSREPSVGHCVVPSRLRGRTGNRCFVSL